MNELKQQPPALAYHLSLNTYHLPPYHVLPIAYRLSPITYHLSPITYHLSLITDHLRVRYGARLDGGSKGEGAMGEAAPVGE